MTLLAPRSHQYRGEVLVQCRHRSRRELRRPRRLIQLLGSTMLLVAGPTVVSGTRLLVAGLVMTGSRPVLLITGRSRPPVPMLAENLGMMAGSKAVLANMLVRGKAMVLE